MAICNSSIESALAAIAFHNLNSSPGTETVKAYGDPTALASDPNVDLVVVSVNIAKHYELTKPALEAGKDVFVEWPLGKTAAEAEELRDLAEARGVRTIVGAQARASPLLEKIKELVAGGGIGNVISTTVVGTLAPIVHDFWIVGAEYYLDRDSGGNTLTISPLGHCKSFVSSTGFTL